MRSIISKIITNVIRFEVGCTGILVLTETRLVPGGHEAAISLHTHTHTLQSTFRVFHSIPVNLMPFFVLPSTSSVCNKSGPHDMQWSGTHGRFQEKYTYIKTDKSGLLKTAANYGDCRHVIIQRLFEYFTSSAT